MWDVTQINHCERLNYSAIIQMDSEKQTNKRVNGEGDSALGGPQAQSSSYQERIFEVLSNERRRYVLAYLKQRDHGRATLSTLATQVAAAENDVPPDRVPAQDRKSVYVGLRQTHLPKMDQYGLVEYDRDRGEIELTETAEQAHTYMEYVPEHDIPWSYHYFGLSAIMGVVTLLAWQGLGPFGELSGLTIATLAIAALGASALVHTIYTVRHRVDRAIEFENVE